MAHVPASPGARYGQPSGSGDYPGYKPPSQQPSGYQPTRYHPPAPPARQPAPPRPARSDDGWDAPTQHVSSAYAAQSPARQRSDAAHAPGTPRPHERGVPSWMAIVILIAIAAIGGGIDLANHSEVKGGFNISVVVASVVAIIIVRRSSMFPVVVAPPLVYFAASAVLLYARSGGLHDRKVLLDAAANWLVYGFPAIAGATAAVLIIGGIRLITGR
ncbi:MAG TPA: DUF6542 domain-containing protein [Jatrophihabitantaceae bacterium]